VRLLVTGGAGFVGSHVVEAALARRHKVTVLDNLSTGLRENVHGKAVLIERDLLASGLDVALEHIAPQAVIHLAACADLRSNWTSIANRHAVFAHNAVATINLLEALGDVPVVFTSSASVYGSVRADNGLELGGRMRPFVEGDASPHTCESPYAACKLACEAFVAAYMYRRRTPYYVARLVNVVGARTAHGVIGDFVRMANANGGKIHAADDGVQRKSWVHVEDVADALVLMAEQGVDRLGPMNEPSLMPSGVYNVTSTEDVSWRDIVTMMRIPEDDVTNEPRSKGAIGDPEGLHTTGAKLAPWFRATRRVEDGIREALASMGWKR
jgi:UDP-glucose 4-epimerase